MYVSLVEKSSFIKITKAGPTRSSSPRAHLTTSTTAEKAPEKLPKQALDIGNKTGIPVTPGMDII